MTLSGAVHSARADLVASCRRLADSGLVTAAAGNASVRVEDKLLITASGARFADLTVDELVLVEGATAPDEDEAVLDGAGRPSSELLLHRRTYARRPDVGAVVHTHGRHAVALSTVTDTVPALHYYCLDLGGPVPVAGYRTFGTAELADETTGVLGARNAVVMAHHGSLTVGPDLAQAASRAELLEWLCEVTLLAMAAGTPRRLDQADLDRVRTRSREGRSR